MRAIGRKGGKSLTVSGAVPTPPPDQLQVEGVSQTAQKDVTSHTRQLRGRGLGAASPNHSLPALQVERQHGRVVRRAPRWNASARSRSRDRVGGVADAATAAGAAPRRSARRRRARRSRRRCRARARRRSSATVRAPGRRSTRRASGRRPQARDLAGADSSGCGWPAQRTAVRRRPRVHERDRARRQVARAGQRLVELGERRGGSPSSRPRSAACGVPGRSAPRLGAAAGDVADEDHPARGRANAS